MNNEITVYGSIVKDVKELIYRKQYEAMKSVNKELIQLYWEIGEEIYHQQKIQGWGKSVIEVLAKELQKEFPGVKGYSAANLWRMRTFYIEYTEKTILQTPPAELQEIDNKTVINLAPMVREIQNSIPPPMVAELQETDNKTVINLATSLRDLKKAILPTLLAEISWSKNIVIMEKCKDALQREFYIRMTWKYGWTKSVLINNIENRAYEKYLTNQTNFEETVPDKYRFQAKLAVKDDYNFDFLEMGLQHSEAEMESAIINNLRAFLIEMGGDFSFVRDQFHLNVADDDYYIDLLLFHRRLRSLIAIDLKIGEFKPEYVGKMQFYLSALDETVKLPDENPSIGIIICKNKNRTRVEYTLKSSTKPIGVATYSHYDNLPKDISSLLPSPEEISNIINNIEGIFKG
ncbi:MAG: PDDEXK nuclease domain-containing protein [Candidatus Cloacimonetes bacterium]|nr:PDDEXK nuclease domain-containing protein [Candidatus Cloacimonadota bacterium]